jgi:hypothetical protein
LIAAIVVIAVVVFLAMGRGGGLSAERSDYLPLDLGPVSATDVALLRPPSGLWGYNMQATDEAMDQIAESIRDRDVRIVALEQLVTDLSRDHAPMPLLASPYVGARHRRSRGDTQGDTQGDTRVDTRVDTQGDTPDSAPGDPMGGPLREHLSSPMGESLGGPAESEVVQAPRDTPPPRSSGLTFGAPGTQAGPTFDTLGTESIQLPFEPPRPSGDVSVPPEQSHD